MMINTIASFVYFIAPLFEQQGLKYHTLLHFVSVVERIEYLCDTEGVLGREKTLLLVAGWLHDVGYLFSLEHHEQAGAEFVGDIFGGTFCGPCYREMMRKESYHLLYQGLMQYMFSLVGMFSSTEIRHIQDLIVSTTMGAELTNVSEYILHDADLDNIGRENFLEWTRLLWKEQNNLGQEVAWEVFLEQTKTFLHMQTFYTPTQQKERGGQLEYNISQLV